MPNPLYKYILSSLIALWDAVDLVIDLFSMILTPKGFWRTGGSAILRLVGTLFISRFLTKLFDQSLGFYVIFVPWVFPDHFPLLILFCCLFNWHGRLP